MFSKLRAYVRRLLNTRRAEILRARWYCWRRNNVRLFLREDGAVGIIFYADSRPPLIDWRWRVPAPESYGFVHTYGDYYRDGYMFPLPPAHPNCRCVVRSITPE